MITTIFARLKSTLGGWLPAAVMEIGLIFAGITLALWFGNWNEEHQLRELEKVALKEIAADLKSDAVAFERNIESDAIIIEACQRSIESMTQRVPWSDAIAKDLHTCSYWSSPFLSEAAYESLKSRGTDLIADPDLRNAIVSLYENSYAYLVEDTDKDLGHSSPPFIYPYPTATYVTLSPIR
jgi:hypothetical protein